MSANLNFTLMAENQASPELTHNDGMGEFDAALTETYSADVSAGNVTLTDLQFQRCVRVLATGAGVARDVTLPNIKRLVILENISTATANVTFKRGTGNIVLAPGGTALAYLDGSTNGIFALSQGGAKPFDINLWIRQKPVASDKILRLKAVRAFSLPTDLAGSSVDAVTAATASTTFTLKKNGSSIGTIVFAASGTVATFTVTATSFAIGDVLTIESPAQDATLSGVSFNIYGTAA